MNPEQIDGLFQEFNQGDTSTTRKYGGTGLGLAISKRLVEMMSGEIRVESQPGSGSHFMFTARFGKVDEQPLALPKPAENIRGLRILVVDDNDSARKITAKHLEALTYDPVCVAGGEKAIDSLVAADADGSPFDLVILDWRMPGMNGMETARQIKTGQLLKIIPTIIMVTAYGQEDVTSSPEDKQLLDGFVMKPVSLMLLFEAIMVAFGHTPISRLLSGNTDSQAANLAGIKLLLAEDNEINQQVARELLQKVGVQLVVADNGQEAVDLVDKEAFDGVLMDLQMPVMDGLEATRRIREQKSAEAFPIIAMTANAMAGDRERCLAVGMNDHVAKPVVPEEMYAMLSKWITNRSEQSAPPKPSREISMVRPLPPLPGIDTTKGLRNVAGNTQLYRNILLKNKKDELNFLF